LLAFKIIIIFIQKLHIKKCVQKIIPQGNCNTGEGDILAVLEQSIGVGTAWRGTALSIKVIVSAVACRARQAVVEWDAAAATVGWIVGSPYVH
jgi:hypothetical protein